MKVDFLSTFLVSLLLFLMLAGLLVNYPSTSTQLPLQYDNTEEISFIEQYDLYPEQIFRLEVSSNFTMAILVTIQEHIGKERTHAEGLKNSSTGVKNVEVVKAVINPARIDNPLNLSVVSDFTTEPFLFEQKATNPMLVTVNVSYSPSQAYTMEALNSSKFPIFPVISIESRIVIKINEKSGWQQIRKTFFILSVAGLLWILVRVFAIAKKRARKHKEENGLGKKAKASTRPMQPETIGNRQGKEPHQIRSLKYPALWIDDPRNTPLNQTRVEKTLNDISHEKKNDWKAILELYLLSERNRNYGLLIATGTWLYFASRTWSVPRVSDLLATGLPSYYRIEWFNLAYQLGVLTVVIAVDAIYGMIRKEHLKMLWSYPLDRQRLFIASYIVVSVASAIAVSLYVLATVLVGDLLLYGIGVNGIRIALLLASHALTVLLVLGILYIGYAIFIDWPKSYFLLLTVVMVAWVFGNIGFSFIAELILIINPISGALAVSKLFIGSAVYIAPFLLKKRLERVNII